MKAKEEQIKNQEKECSEAKSKLLKDIENLNKEKSDCQEKIFEGLK